MPVNKGQLGGIFGGIGLLMLIMSLLINNLSGQDTDTNDTKCTWNKIEICDYNNCHEDSFKNGCKISNDLCHQQNAGIIYLIFIIIAIVASLCGILGAFIGCINNKIQNYIRFLFLFSAICCIIAICVWIGIGSTSKICYDPEWENHGRYVGGSIILPSISIFIFIIAMILVWSQHQKPNGYETLF